MTSRIVTRLQNLYFSENKPPQLRPVDIALVSYLVHRQTEDHYIFDSYLTLADRLGCERRTIADSVTRLSAMGWITTRKAWQWNETTKQKTRTIGKTTGLSVVLDKLPQAKDKAKHSPPSQYAINLAKWHSALLKDNNVGRKTRYKTFDQQQQYAAQKLIDELGVEKVSDVLDFALSDKRHQRKARKSLYEVRVALKAIQRDYDAAQAASSSKSARPPS
jgi:hypothetical protein